MTSITIDKIGFNIASVKAMKESEFIAQYTDQKPPSSNDKDWLQWMKEAYGKITGKPSDSNVEVKK